MPKRLPMFKMKDKNESYHKKKGLLFDMPYKIALVGRSMLSGKTNSVSNLLMRDEFYKNDIDGENIYIFSPSAKTDYKLKTLIEERDIPQQNVYDSYNEDVIDGLYEVLKDEFNEKVNAKERPDHKLFLFDDMTASGDLKKHTNGAINKIFSNGRHVLINVIVTAQKYSDLPTFARENLSGGMFFAGTDRQLELIMDDHNYMEDKRQFKKMYRETTKEPHSFLVVNYSNHPDARYMDSDFVPISN